MAKSALSMTPKQTLKYWKKAEAAASGTGTKTKKAKKVSIKRPKNVTPKPKKSSSVSTTQKRFTSTPKLPKFSSSKKKI